MIEFLVISIIKEHNSVKLSGEHVMDNDVR